MATLPCESVFPAPAPLSTPNWTQFSYHSHSQRAIQQSKTNGIDTSNRIEPLDRRSPCQNFNPKATLNCKCEYPKELLEAATLILDNKNSSDDLLPSHGGSKPGKKSNKP
ncbi:hypothetical protein PGT21_021235 [Puccinia graminis f. sp. tritici]|uniref:Uncharacterized protein n=1 Tax=Puccinia graminis f. sp. tritici TaxID=56615 RepID=A0A5B0QGE3_PUCGR|nr:hypothetical protein PGT21_021235 [Puccinia graminis f. sp. tritici]